MIFHSHHFCLYRHHKTWADTGRIKDTKRSIPPAAPALFSVCPPAVRLISLLFRYLFS
jgi:hypothetical protein